MLLFNVTSLLFFHNVYSINKRFPNYNFKVKRPVRPVNEFKTDLPIINAKTLKSELSTGKLALNEVDSIPLPRIDLYVRKFGQGFWIRFKGIQGTDEVHDKFSSLSVCTGIEEESIRNEIDAFISTELFGAGIGAERAYIKSARQTLPHMKKVKVAEFEFGYKYMSLPPANASTVDPTLTLTDSLQESVVALCSKERSKLMMSKVHTTNRLNLPQNVSKSVESLMEEWNRSNRISYLESHDTMLKQASTAIDEFLSACEKRNCNSLLAVCDGSANFEKQTCLIASAGVVLLPFDTCVLQKPPLHLSLHISAGSVFVNTPFDAELLGGFAAFTILKRVALQRTFSKLEPLSIYFLTDSKTLHRILRAEGPTENDDGLALKYKNSTTRIHLWGTLRKHLNFLNGENSTVDLQLEWVSGHPERLNSAVEEWSAKERGIWVADELAKGNMDAVTNLFGLIARRNESKRKTEQRALRAALQAGAKIVGDTFRDEVYDPNSYFDNATMQISEIFESEDIHTQSTYDVVNMTSSILQLSAEDLVRLSLAWTSNDV